MTADLTFLPEISRLSGQPLGLCYHCHTCTAGCPVSVDMTFGPDRLLRLVELGQRQRVLRAPDIWLCAGCALCAARCPNGIDLAAVMDALRQASLAAGVPAAQPQVALFHRLYLAVIRLLGRAHEALLLGGYKLLSLDLISDMTAGMQLVRRGKIPLLPLPIRGAGEVRRLYRAALAADRRREAEGRRKEEGQ